jgi:hypothetical protein
MANGWGGRRPGAGAKKKETIDEQKVRRAIVHEVFTPAEWRAVLLTWLAEVKNGNIGVIYPLLPYLMGSPKQEIEVNIRQEAERIAAERGVPAGEIISLADELKKRKAV